MTLSSLAQSNDPPKNKSVDKIAPNYRLFITVFSRFLIDRARDDKLSGQGRKTHRFPSNNCIVGVQEEGCNVAVLLAVMKMYSARLPPSPSHAEDGVFETQR